MTFAIAARKLGILLGAFFVAALLAACSPPSESETDRGTYRDTPSPERKAAEDFSWDAPSPKSRATDDFFWASSSSPESVAKSFLETAGKGDFKEATFKYVITGAMMECLFVRKCTEREIDSALRKLGLTEEKILEGRELREEEMRKRGLTFDDMMLEFKSKMEQDMGQGGEKLFSEAQEIFSDAQKKGGIDSISTALVSQTEDKASVVATTRFGNGEVEDEETITLVKVSGEWKIEKVQKASVVLWRYGNQDVRTLAADQEATAIGRRLFATHCTQCHGADATGKYGVPNLTDNDWLYGGEPNNIMASIAHGRRGVMTSNEYLGADKIKALAHYVRSKNGLSHDATLAERGHELYATEAACRTCHGDDMRGHKLLGAPDLTNNIWLYGSSEEEIIKGITYGRNIGDGMSTFNHCPSKDLDDAKVRLLAAYVYSLSH